jgi:hypothetical protein
VPPRESYSFRLRLPAEEGFSVVTCLMTLDPTSPLGRALVPPRVPQLRTPPPRWGGLRRRRLPHDSLWATVLKNK